MKSLFFIFLVSVMFSQPTQQQTCTVPSFPDTCAIPPVGYGNDAECTQIALDTAVSGPLLLALSSDNLNGILLPGTTLSELTEDASDILLEAANSRGYNVNLRVEPSTEADVVGAMRYDAIEMADARTDDNAWVRLKLDGQSAWIAASLITLSDDIEMLPIATAGSSSSVVSLMLISETSECAGLMLAHDGDGTAITINAVPLRLSNALVHVQTWDESLLVHIISGSVHLGSQDFDYGTVVVNDDEITVIEPQYTFEQLQSLPVDVLTETAPSCLVGIAATGGAAGYVAPENGATTAFNLSSDTFYRVDRQSTDGTWWRVVTSDTSAWVASGEVQSFGNCENLRQIEPRLAPSDVIYRYLEARLVSDVAMMQSLSCASWDSQAIIQSQSFQAMNAELQNVACYLSSEGDREAVVTCDGNIVTNYNDQLREWPLGSYRLIVEEDQWRMCGEH